MDDARRWTEEYLRQIVHVNSALFGLSLALIAGTATIGAQAEARALPLVMNLLILTLITSVFALFSGVVAAVSRLALANANAAIASRIHVLGEADRPSAAPIIASAASKAARIALALQFGFWILGLGAFCAALWLFLLGP